MALSFMIEIVRYIIGDPAKMESFKKKSSLKTIKLTMIK